MPSVSLALSGNGDNTVVAAVAGSAIRVLSFLLSWSAAVNAKFTDGASGTTLCGLLYGIGTGPVVIVAPELSFGARGWFQTSKGNALVLNLSAGTAVGGVLVYELIGQ